MMRGKVFSVLAAVLLSVFLTGCKEEMAGQPKPQPQEPTATSIAYFCSMGVLEHSGPKGQAFRAGRSEPVWFASVRDAIAYTMLPEEPKDVVAIYVNDMGKSRDGYPEAGAWVEAHDAWYVIGSDYSAGMGGNEAVPFSEEQAARAFAEAHRGTVTRFDKMPEKYILQASASDGADENFANETEEHGNAVQQ